MIDPVGNVCSGKGIRSLQGRFAVAYVIVGVAVCAAPAHRIAHKFIPVIVGAGVRQVGCRRVKVVFLRDRAPQYVVRVVGFSRVVGAAGAQVVNLHREVALFFQSAPPFQGVGVIKSVQQAGFLIVAIGEGLPDGVQRNGG